MTRFDTVFDTACQTAGLGWVSVYDTQDKQLKADKQISMYPCVLRSFSEPVTPLYDIQNRFIREMNLYIIHVGFTHKTPELINEDLEDIMTRFNLMRDYMRRHGCEIEFLTAPLPSWQQFGNVDEFGFVYSLKVTYKSCLT